MKPNNKLITVVRIFVLIIGCFVSYNYFGVSLPFAICVTYLIIISFLIIQELDATGWISVISIFSPHIVLAGQATVLKNLDYSKIIKVIDELLKVFNLHYGISRNDIDTFIVCTILALVFYLSNNRDKTALGKHEISKDPEFRKKSFAEKNDAFCKHLSHKLDRINTESNWSSETYTPIAAEVEMSAGKKIERYTDMLVCLKKNNKHSFRFLRTLVYRLKYSNIGKIRFVNSIINLIEEKINTKRVYLVLGDPGSGKSVSLRKLCADLLKESLITGKTPVYINLKTWKNDDKQWSCDNLPTDNDLRAYVKKEVYSGGVYSTDDFLDEYYEKMLEDGRWYFVFDSFDEMPCLMSGEKNTVLINRISSLIYNFLTAPNQSGGIVASRLYNKPAGTLKQTYTLKLQRFSDARIRLMIKRYKSGNVDEIIRYLFRDRPDLVNLCRNPFHLSLLINYIQKQNNRFPDNQFDLFKDFVTNRLRKSDHMMSKYKLSFDDVYSAAVQLAINMQDKKHQGLEYSVNDLTETDTGISSKDWDKYISLLEYVKICRVGENRETVSFVHRRFQEFFYVEGIIREKIIVDESEYSSILDNTGIRDALVLYCQIGEYEQIQKIVSYCCSAIKNNIQGINSIRNECSVRFVNALYFLTEAFCYRKDALGDNLLLIAELNKYLQHDTDFIVQMAIVNSMSLLPSEDIQKTVLKVFTLNNRWLNGRIVSNCQLIKELNFEEEIGFCSYFDAMQIREFLDNYLNIDFSLSLSDCFSYVRVVHKLMLVLIANVLTCITIECIVEYKQMHDFVRFFLEKYSIRMVIQDIMRNGSYSIQSNRQLKVLMTSELRVDTIAILCLINIMLCVLLFAVRALYIDSEYESKGFMEKETIKDLLKEATNNVYGNRDSLESIFTIALRIGESNSAFILYSNVLLFALYTVYGQNVGYSHLLLGGDKWKTIVIVLLSINAFIYLYEVTHELFSPFLSRLSGIRLNKQLLHKIIRGILYITFIWLHIIWATCKLLLGCALLLSSIWSVSYLLCFVLNLRTDLLTISRVFYVIAIIIFVLYIVFKYAVSGIRLILEMSWIKKQRIQEIKRKDFVDNVNKLHFRSTRREYLEYLVSNDVVLIDEWPNQSRLVLDDDVFNRELAMWDCKEYAMDNYFSSGS